MSTIPPTLPLTIAGRSPFDGIRIRWAGLAAACFGVGLFFTADPAGIFFGVMLLGLGLATWLLSGFGNIWWFDIPTPQRYVVGTGAIIGLLTFIVFVGGLIVIGSTIRMAASGNR